MRSSWMMLCLGAAAALQGCFWFDRGGDPDPDSGSDSVDDAGSDPRDAASDPGSDGAAPPPGPGDSGSPPPPPGPRYERYIRGDVETRLVIEVDSVAGAEPLAAAEERLVARLSSLLDKPAGIEIVHDDTIASRGAEHAWTFAELSALAQETFDDDEPAGTISMHVMWLDGHDESDSSEGAVLGLAWGHTHMVMYHDTLESSCQGSVVGGAQVCEEAQYLVWLHEVGHTIGLVDNGLPMTTDHRDPDHGAHDVSDDCVMYWAFEARSGITLLRDRLLGGSLPDFDPACLADVRAVRDR